MAEPLDDTDVDDLELDEAVTFTSDLIRIDTTNRGGGDCRERPAAEYVAERLTEAKLEPVLLESAPGRANVVARVEGTEPSLGALLVHGHLDVVPARARDWRVDPFSGEVRDGVVWGRGAVDMKNADAMILAVVRGWARTGRRPRRDVVLAFTADEEDTASFGSDFLVRRHPDLFEGCTEGISESGAYTMHAAPGVRLYPIATGERGTAWLRLDAVGQAGHGSKTRGDNAVTKLAHAVSRIGEYRWPLRLTPTTRAALRGIGEALGLEVPELETLSGQQLESVVDALVARMGPAASLVVSTLRNSSNPTMLDAGYKVNVIPGSATGHVDGRVLPGHVEEFETTVSSLTGQDVSWEYLHREVPLEAPHDSPTVAAMTEALLFEAGRLRDSGEVDGGHDHVITYSMSGGTDAKQFSRLGIIGYGFTPLYLPEGYDYHAMFHGVDERVPVNALHFGVRTLDRFLSRVG